MPISDLLTTPCLLLRRSPSGSTNRYGDEALEETTVETVCALQQQQRLEGGTHEDLSDTRWLLVLPAGTEVDTDDAVEIDGLRYELVGAPWPVTDHSTGATDHIEATVRRTAGSEDVS